MRIALVHDDLVQFGGAERVLEGLMEIYPDAPIFTSVFDGDNKELRQRFGAKDIRLSFLQKIPGWRALYKALLPLYPIAFEQFDFTGFDLVISHTTRFAKSVITKPGTIHICYCHTPPRFLWNFSGENQYGWMWPLMDYLRKYDKISANRVDFFLAGSKNALSRIKKVYGMESDVVYPFIDLKRFEGVGTFDGGYFVVIARLNKYKRVDLAVEACRRLELPLKVIGDGPEMDNLKGRKNSADFLGDLSDEMVVQVLAGARALIIPGIEDFGLVALEAQALGKPVIVYNRFAKTPLSKSGDEGEVRLQSSAADPAKRFKLLNKKTAASQAAEVYKEGGTLETVIEGKTGLYFDEQIVDSLIQTLRWFSLDHFNEKECIKNARRFSKENFKKDFEKKINTLL